MDANAQSVKCQTVRQKETDGASVTFPVFASRRGGWRSGARSYNGELKGNVPLTK